MITARLCGGLGNQLFQIFTTIAHAYHYSKPFFFLDNYELRGGSIKRHTYWNTFLSALNPFLKNIEKIPPLQKYEEPSYTYKKITNDNYAKLLVGYFQSYKYFDLYKEIIYKLLKIDAKKYVVFNKINALNIVNFREENIISVHFRFGDYKLYPELYHLLDETYYINSLRFIIGKLDKSIPIKVLYFVEEDSRTDAEQIINKLKTEFVTIREFIYIDNTFSDWQQMLLMSLCNHNVIANSTFSWWGAYLNTNKDPIICCPDKWFTLQSGKDIKDLYPLSWTRI